MFGCGSRFYGILELLDALFSSYRVYLLKAHIVL